MTRENLLRLYLLFLGLVLGLAIGLRIGGVA